MADCSPFPANRGKYHEIQKGGTRPALETSDAPRTILQGDPLKDSAEYLWRQISNDGHLPIHLALDCAGVGLEDRETFECTGYFELGRFEFCG